MIDMLVRDPKTEALVDNGSVSAGLTWDRLGPIYIGMCEAVECPIYEYK